MKGIETEIGMKEKATKQRIIKENSEMGLIFLGFSVEGLGLPCLSNNFCRKSDSPMA